MNIITIKEDVIPEIEELMNLYGDVGWSAYTNDGIQQGQWPEWVINNEERPSKRYTFTSFNHYTIDSPLQSSGLLGPVTIQVEESK